MRGIILAGGMGTRLRPLTLVANKHALPIYDKPMAFHIVEYLRDASIFNIMLITGREHCGDLIGILGSGRDLGVELTYRVQEDPDGIAGALRLCRDFAQGGPVMVILGDNLLENGVCPLVGQYYKYNKGAMIFATEVEDPERFGVVTLDADGKVINIVEKPKEPETNLAVIGVYIFDHQVFTFIDTLKPSGRGELEITDVNRKYMELGRLRCGKVQGWWHDAGTIESMYAATILVRETRLKEKGKISDE
jgi:glucose-1-phosphate thymidylyltransferase